MRVSLLSTTPEADVLLCFTKSTRLNMSPSLLDEVRSWTPEKRQQELAYIANTIPSSWEFVDYVFLVEGVSRAYTHQQVRTRAASYAQQTMRVLDMGQFDYVYTERNLRDPVAKGVIDECLKHIQSTYQQLRAMGQPAEDARGILPTNISTNIVCKFNLRTMVDLVKSRSGGRTQGEYQQVVLAMANEIVAVHPWAEQFLFPRGRNYYKEIEAFAEEEFGGDLLRKGRLLKIVDRLRGED